MKLYAPPIVQMALLYFSLFYCWQNNDCDIKEVTSSMHHTLHQRKKGNYFQIYALLLGQILFTLGKSKARSLPSNEEVWAMQYRWDCSKLYAPLNWYGFIVCSAKSSHRGETSITHSWTRGILFWVAASHRNEYIKDRESRDRAKIFIIPGPLKSFIFCIILCENSWREKRSTIVDVDAINFFNHGGWQGLNT